MRPNAWKMPIQLKERLSANYLPNDHDNLTRTRLNLRFSEEQQLAFEQTFEFRGGDASHDSLHRYGIEMGSGIGRFDPLF